MEKIFLSVKESDIKSRFLDYDFYFSSNARKERFEKKLFDYITNETLKFKNKYNIKVEQQTFHRMFAFILYSHCEKRGFKVIRTNESDSLIYEELPTFSVYGFINGEGK